MEGKRIKVVIITILVLLLVALVSYYLSTVLPDRNYSVQNNATSRAEVVIESDSDNDGLKDWEEVLWGTDPNVADSDNDGTSDFDEVENGRDPTRPGPNDPLPDQSLVSSETNTDDNKTDKFARDVFSKYVTLKQAGVSVDGDIADYLTEDFLDVEDIEIEVKQYSIEDLNVATGESLESIKNYGNEVGSSIFRNVTTLENEFDVLARLINKQSQEDVDSFKAIITGYRNLARESVSISIPKSAVSNHIAFLNAISAIAESVNSMSLIYNDPIIALSAIGEHEENILNLAETFEKMKTYFGSKGVIFEQHENGYIFGNAI